MTFTYTLSTLKKNIKFTLNQLPKYKLRGDYTDVEVSDYRKVVLLLFGEIESYVESLCEDIINNSLSNFNTSKVVDKYLATLLFKLDISIEKRRKVTLNTHVMYSIQQYKSSSIGTNHGISIDNLYKIFSLIGVEHLIDESNIGMVFVNDINTFSSERGLFAHSSKNNGMIISKIQPKELKNRINNIITGLKYITINI